MPGPLTGTGRLGLMKVQGPQALGGFVQPPPGSLQEPGSTEPWGGEVAAEGLRQFSLVPASAPAVWNERLAWLLEPPPAQTPAESRPRPRAAYTLLVSTAAFTLPVG